MAERPNPESIGICALIALYSDPNSPLHNLRDDGGSPIAESENKVAAFLEESVFGTHGSNPGLFANGIGMGIGMGMVGSDSLEAWMLRLKNRLGRQAADLVMDTLAMASESVDALMDLFESLDEAMHEGLVDVTSLHGLYLRQRSLGFVRLSFESSILLWRALRERVSAMQEQQRQRQEEQHQPHGRPGDPRWPGPNKDDGDDECETNAIVGAPPVGRDDRGAPWLWPLSTEQLQSILREDCTAFEAEQARGGIGNGNDRDRGRGRDRGPRPRTSFEEMEVYIRNMLKIDPELPAAHFLRYLNCLRHGERVGALDALHEYFDHSMVQHKGRRQGTDATTAAASASASASFASSSGDILQFSAILLAMTHSSFGDSNLALLATEEAVRVAQQSKDASCVAFALGWLYEHHGQGTAERTELLRRCARRAAQGQLRPLVAGAQLTLARNALLGNGGDGAEWERTSANASASANASTVPSANAAAGEGGGASSWTTVSWNHLLQVTAEPSTDHSGALDRPTHLSQNPGEVLESMAMQRLVSAGIWDSLGMPAMSEWASKAALNQHNELSYDDLLAAIQNISRCALYGTQPKPLAATNRPRHENHAPACSYARAVSALLQLRIELRLDGNDLEEPILQHLALVFHEWAVRRGDMDDALALRSMLDSCLHPGLHNRDQLCADTRMQEFLFLRRAKDWDGARGVGGALVRFCKQKGFSNHRARILIQMGIAELDADPNRCTTALSPLLEALAICEAGEMHGLHAAAMSILAQVFLRLANPKRAIAILEGTLPTLLQREHVWFQAEAYRSLARAHLKLNANFVACAAEKPATIAIASATATATNSKRGTPAANQNRNQNQNHRRAHSETVRKRFHRALAAFQKSSRLFEECHDKQRLREVYYLQARIHMVLGNTSKRDAVSETFVALLGKRRGANFDGGGGIDGGDTTMEGCRGDPDTTNTNTTTTTTTTTTTMSILDALGDPIAIRGLVGRSILE